MITVALKVGGEYYLPTLHFARTEIHGPGPVNTWHCHDVFHVIYVVEGNGFFRLGEREAEARPGLLFFIEPRVWHQFIALTDPFCYDALTFELTAESGRPCDRPFWEIFSRADRRWMRGVLREGVLEVPEQLRTQVRALFSEVNAAWSRGLGGEATLGLERSGPAVAGFLQGLGELVVRLAPGGEKAVASGAANARRRRLVEEAVRFMNEHFAEPLTVEQIAGRVHLHPVYFSQLFKAAVGVPPRQYLVRIRINQARRLLAETDMPVGEIAQNCGFRTIAYFSRVFREIEGVSPSVFRRQNPPPGRVLA